MCPEEVRVKPDAGDPVRDEPCVLLRCQASTCTTSAREEELAGFFAAGSHMSSIAWRVSSVSSNLTGRPIFFCRTVARSTAYPLGATSSTLSATTSHPRSLLSMARLNIARSRVRRSICSLVRIDQTCFGRNGGFGPISLPLFHGWRLGAIGMWFSLV
jgi:hypothetical protein